MSEAVLEVLNRIEKLPEEDRLVLEKHLADMAESEWRCEADTARRIARDRGLNQTAIDKAIAERGVP